MADDSKDDAEGKAAKAAPGKKKSKLFLVIALVLAVGAGGAGSYFLLKPAAAAKANTKKSKSSKADMDDDDSDQQTDDGADGKTSDGKEKTGKDDKSKSGVSALMLPKDKEVKKVIDLQPFILNLADKDENRFLRLSLGLGMGEEGEEKPDPVFTTRVRNAVLAVLMTKTSADVLSAEGKATLRKELLQAIRAAAEEPRVLAIYITELIVQR